LNRAEISGQEIYIMIPGEPVSKNRPRFARIGKGVRTYSDQEDEQSLWVMEARKQTRRLNRFFDGAVEIRVRFWIKRPAGHYGSGKNAEILRPSALVVPEKKSDLDNYEKFMLDCLNHCHIWKDDSYVVGIDSKKRFADNGTKPRTEIFITSNFEV
jgi:Holliday junction resolvase RusA-like endonuclease